MAIGNQVRTASAKSSLRTTSTRMSVTAVTVAVYFCRLGSST